MYIKLTRFDNRPVWLNAAFIVTVEPRRDGSGSVVVPIGDGLDYDVRESPEEVLRMLDGCPAPQVVPVPVSDCLTNTPADVSPEPERRMPDPEVRPPSKPVQPPSEPAAQHPSTPVQQPSEPAAQPPSEPVQKKPEEKPAAEAADSTAKSAKRESRPRRTAAERKPKVTKKPKLELTDEDVVRLGKLAPKTVAKLKNTLLTQFHVEDASATVAALETKGVLALDGSRINWNLSAENGR